MAKRRQGPAIELPADDPRWQIKVTFANIGEKDDFMEIVQEAMQTGSSAEMYPWLARFITAWPFEGLDPANADDYRKLSFEQWDEVQRWVAKALASFRW